MRAVVILLLLAGLAGLGYFLWTGAERQRAVPAPPAATPPPTPVPTPAPTPPPTPVPEARFAPEGVLFVVRRFSETHDGGVRGFPEGAEVRLLRQEEGYYVVTDGVVEARRPRTWFTRDLALARDLREKRLTDRAQLQKRLDEERATFETRENDRAARWSSALDNLGAGRRPSVPAPSPGAAPPAVLRPLRLGAWNLEFFGIQITFNYRGKHNPPHFHAWHAGCEGVFAIQPLSYLYGDLSPRAVALVMEWAMLHEDELIACWQLAREMKPLPIIKPLS